MQALPSGHRTTELPAHFPCAACGNTIERPQGDTITTGYAVRSSDNEMICYACAHKDELQHAKETGHLFAYVRELPRTGQYPLGSLDWIINKTHVETYNKPLARIAAIVTWPGLALSVGLVLITGHYRSNFGDERITLSCRMPTGPQGTLETWHGTAYTSAGNYCHMHRGKQYANGKES